MEGGCWGTQLVDENGVFNVEGLQNFTRNTKLSHSGLSYAVVAIMGPQSSGKSTLLNHLFYTNFREMDACRGRSQTTKGIWIAKGTGTNPFTIVLDLEGTDSSERGKDDTAFEKQSALFALATADIVLINMWCHDIGREHAADKPLLETVFEVMVRLFSPRKATLLFVIRDKTKTPLKYLESILREDVQKIWAEVAKPKAHKNAPLSEFFNVEVTALPSYEEKEEQFKEQVPPLRLLISHFLAPGGLAGDRKGAVPASGFALSAEQIWRKITENKDLDLPAHKVMVATVRCEEIAKENLKLLTSDEEWVAFEKAIQAGPIAGYGEKVSSILASYLMKYDEESIHFDKGVREEKRKQLELNALDVVRHSHTTMLDYLHAKSVERFKTRLEQLLRNREGLTASAHICKQSCMLEFDEGCKDAAIRQASWDASEVREKLCHEIETYVSSVKSSMLSETFAKYEKQLSDALSSIVESLFDVCKNVTWAEIRMHLKLLTDNALRKFSKAVNSFELDRSTIEAKELSLREHARNIVEKKAREEVGKVLFRMKDRFTMVFNHHDGLKPRVWTGREEIMTVKKEARYASLKILSLLAAIRLEKKEDNIQEVLFSSLMDGTAALPSSEDRSSGAAMDPLATNAWEEVPSDATLLTPVLCKALWEQFIAETEYEVTQAISAQEALELIRRRSSFLWRIAENAGAVAAGTATGVALVAVGVAVGPAGAVGGAVGLVLAAAATGMRQVVGCNSRRCMPLVEGYTE